MVPMAGEKDPHYADRARMRDSSSSSNTAEGCFFASRARRSPQPAVVFSLLSRKTLSVFKVFAVIPVITSCPMGRFRANRGSFMPTHNVSSAVVSLKRYEQPPHKVKNEPIFFKIVKPAFAQRRKQLANRISAYFRIPKVIPVKKS